MTSIKEGDFVKHKVLKDIWLIKTMNSEGVTLEDMAGDGQTFYASSIIDKFYAQYELLVFGSNVVKRLLKVNMFEISSGVFIMRKEVRLWV